MYAYGIRNAGGGIRVSPQTGELWCSVNERDALGDNLVPDYITHVQEGGFYGGPWWYMGAHQDPRHEGKHPELRDYYFGHLTPDRVLFSTGRDLVLEPKQDGPNYFPESVMQMLAAEGISREDVQGRAEPGAAADGGA